jgi:hypothetical protein
MQDIREVLRIKEQQFEQLQKEIHALRMTVKILEESEAFGESGSQEPSTGTAKENGRRPTIVPMKQFP